MVKKNTLAGLELFVGLSDHALRTIATMSEELQFAPGGVIFSPEHSSHRIFLLLKGSVRLTVFSSPLPEPMTVAVLETPGQAFGFSSVVGQAHHNSSAEAATDVSVVAIDGGPFMEYLENNPAVGFSVMKRVARVISRRLGAMRRLWLETIIDYERPASNIPEN